MPVITINGKEAMKLKKNKDGYIEEFGRRKGKGKHVIILYYQK